MNDGAEVIEAWRPKTYPIEAVAFARGGVLLSAFARLPGPLAFVELCEPGALFDPGRPRGGPRSAIPLISDRALRDRRHGGRQPEPAPGHPHQPSIRRPPCGAELCQPLPVALPRSRAKIPYSPGEIDAYLALADTQPSLPRRMRLQAMVCLGAGAGLTGADLRDLRGDDVMFSNGGLVVAVRGRSPRDGPGTAPLPRRASEMRPPSPAAALSSAGCRSIATT